MQYIRIKQEYMDFLREKDERIPNQDYGEGKYKPFYILGSLSGEDVLYATQLTSPKPRHHHLKNNLDFKKIYDPNTGKLLGATNLNYMFPVLPEYIEHLSFHDLKEILKNDYKVRTLAIEKSVLNKMNLEKDFQKLYRIKYAMPESAISRRCLDFKDLEANMLEFKLNEQFERDDFTVERSDDYSAFLIQTKNSSYEYSESILKDMYGFMADICDELQYEQPAALNKNNDMSLE